MTTPDTAVPRLVVVDDTDPTIRYSGAFSLDSTGLLDSQGYGGAVFNRTITGVTTNASLSYNFKGSFVRAMVAGTGLYGWNCSVDNHPITSFQVNSSQVTNYIACDSAGTLTGSTNEHTLDVNFYFFPDVSPPNSSLWLDSIQYQPLPTDPLDAVTLRVHNSDPSVSYSNSSGGWTYQGFGSNGTVITGTSMTFDFNGTSASLYSVNFGYPNAFNPSTAFYSIDGNSTDFDLPGSTTVASISPQLANIQNWPLFTTSNLSPSQHSLQVATSYNATTQPQYLTINYFLIKTNPANSSSPEGSSNSTANPGSSGSSGSSGSDHSSSKSAPVGPIVGGVVGGVVGLAALILIIYFVRRRRRNTGYHQGGMFDLNAGTPPSRNYPSEPQMYSIAPSAPSDFSSAAMLSPGTLNQFSPLPTSNIAHMSSGAGAVGMAHMYSSPPSAPSDYSSNSGKFSANSLYVQNQDSSGPAMYPGSVAGSVAGSSSSPRSQTGFDPSRLISMKNAQSMKVRDEQLQNTEVRMHTDSGVRLPSSNEREVVDVPPTYTET